MAYQMGKNLKFKWQKTRPSPNEERKLVLAKKYYNLWKIHIEYKKRNKYLVEREKLFDEKIVSFISDLRINSNMCLQNVFTSSGNLFETKSDISSKTKKTLCTESYQNRFQAQKYIINNQKALIAEQNDIINRLKCNSSTPDDHNLTIFCQEELNFLDKQVENTKVIPKPIEHPLVKRMKEREEGRKNRWSLSALKRKEKEKFLAEKLKEEEEERRKLEEKKRKLRIQEKREKERLIKELEMKKQREQEICDILAVKVNSFYKRLLCAKALRIWKQYLKYLQYLQSRCSKIYDMSILQDGLLTWKYRVLFVKDLLHGLARRFDENYILLSGWHKWKRKIHGIRSRRKKITIWYDKEITRIIFKRWLSATYKIVHNKEVLLQSMVIIYDRILLLKAFGLWKQLPRVLYLEREKEKRLREWESRVKSILPDYNMQLL